MSISQRLLQPLQHVAYNVPTINGLLAGVYLQKFTCNGISYSIEIIVTSSH